MACWICMHQMHPTVSEAVGTCSDCWVHACDQHGERLANAKFRCAVNTARVRYDSLVFASAAALPLVVDAVPPPGAQLEPSYAWGPASPLWRQSAAHRAFWRERIEQVLEQAIRDPHSPWFDRELPRGEDVLNELADLVGLVAWYLGMKIDEQYPSLESARYLLGPGEPNGVVLAWLFERLRITPAEVVYLLRYYAATTEPGETSADWGLGELYALVLTNPFLR
jgi:hypothetical protein